MAKTVKEIANILDPENNNSSKLRQRVRDEIKRQGITTSKENGRIKVSEKDVKIILKNLESKNTQEIKQTSVINLAEDLQESSRKNKILEASLKEKDAEIRRLNTKIEQFAEDFKEMNQKQMELNNHQQQLQARILEQTTQLENTQKKLLESADKSAELQEKVEKVEKASLWQRIIKNYDK